jgi:hypothetical protein
MVGAGAEGGGAVSDATLMVSREMLAQWMRLPSGVEITDVRFDGPQGQIVVEIADRPVSLAQEIARRADIERRLRLAGRHGEW